jgi:hydroxymethylglutaryl-CoA reductase (NADPH)
MPAIPPVLLKKLYVKGSLRAEGDGFALDLKNTIAPGTIQGFRGLELDGAPVDLAQVSVVQPDGQARPAAEISAEAPLQFPLGATFTLRVAGTPLGSGDHRLKVRVVVQDVGPLEIPVADRGG